MNDQPGAVLTTYRGAVLPEWVDYNGHLRDAYYLLLFSYASDALMERIGLDAAGRQATGHSIFTLECHLNFLLEVKEGAAVEVHTQVLGFDAKRLHIYHCLHTTPVLPTPTQPALAKPTLAQSTSTQPTLAANEQMLLNVELAGPRSAPFAAPVYALVQALAARHKSLPRPQYAGRVIALPS